VATTSPEVPGREPKRVVLVVDDEQGLRDLVCRTLRAEGYSTLEAAHGAEALEVMETAAEPVDLVVTDVVMPGMDGRELGRRLSQRWPDLPILYLCLRGERHLPPRLAPAVGTVPPKAFSNGGAGHDRSGADPAALARYLSNERPRSALPRIPAEPNGSAGTQEFGCCGAWDRSRPISLPARQLSHPFGVIWVTDHECARG
jgi:CheY-like chemotaxis protein